MRRPIPPILSVEALLSPAPNKPRKPAGTAESAASLGPPPQNRGCDLIGQRGAGFEQILTGGGGLGGDLERSLRNRGFRARSRLGHLVGLIGQPAAASLFLLPVDFGAGFPKLRFVLFGLA